MCKITLIAKEEVNFTELCTNFIKWCESRGYELKLTGSGFIYNGDTRFNMAGRAITFVGDDKRIHQSIDGVGGIEHLLRWFLPVDELDCRRVLETCPTCSDPDMIIWELPELARHYFELRPREYKDRNKMLSREYSEKATVKANAVKAEMCKYTDPITTSEFSTLSSAIPSWHKDGLAKISETFGVK